MEANRKEEFTKDLYWLGARAVVAGEATLDQVVGAFAVDFGRDRDETRMKVQKRIEDLRAREPAPVPPAEGGEEPLVLIGSNELPAVFNDIDVEELALLEGAESESLHRCVRVSSPEGSPVPVRVLTLGDVVRSAQARSGLSAKDWNALSQEAREVRIADELDSLRTSARARTAAENRINEVGLVAPDTTADGGEGTAMATGAIDGVLAGKIGAEGIAAGFDAQSDMANANVAAALQDFERGTLCGKPMEEVVEARAVREQADQEVAADEAGRPPVGEAPADEGTEPKP